MECLDDTPTTTIVNKVCNCDLRNYYCHCDGEDKLLDELKEIGEHKLKKINVLFKHAIYNDHLKVFNWLYINYQSQSLDLSSITKYAVKNGKFNVLKWLYAQEILFHYCEEDDYSNHNLCDFDYWFCNNLFDYATANGHLNVLEWLHDMNPRCDWDYSQCIIAGRNGNLEILKWLINNNKPVNFMDNEIEISCLKYLFEINKIATIKNKINLQQIECFNRICEF